MPQEKFHYKSLEEVKQRAAELGVDLPFAADTHALAQPLTVRNITFPNRLGIAPMEGADSTPEGAPTEYTTRRYVNEAIGGSSVIWFEAISIVEEGRSSQTQLLLNRGTLDEFKKMTAAVKEAGLKANGYAPYLIMQANHSGRYSNPGNKPAPMIAYRHPILEQYRAADDSCVVTRRLPERVWRTSSARQPPLPRKQALTRWTSRAATATCWQSWHPPTTAPASTAAALKTASAC